PPGANWPHPGWHLHSRCCFPARSWAPPAKSYDQYRKAVFDRSDWTWIRRGSLPGGSDSPGFHRYNSIEYAHPRDLAPTRWWILHRPSGRSRPNALPLTTQGGSGSHRFRVWAAPIRHWGADSGPRAAQRPPPADAPG